MILYAGCYALIDAKCVIKGYCPMFCRSLDMTSNLFAHFVTVLGYQRWEGGQKCPETRLIEMFHSHLDPVAQINIPTNFAKRDLVMRCIITTLAFGLGMNIPDIDYILHWRPPSEVLKRLEGAQGTVGLVRLFCTALLIPNTQRRYHPLMCTQLCQSYYICKA